MPSEPRMVEWPSDKWDKLVEDLAAKLNIRHWYQGDDGFGGEWIIDPKHEKAIREFHQKAYAYGFTDGTKSQLEYSQQLRRSKS